MIDNHNSFTLQKINIFSELKAVVTAAYYSAVKYPLLKKQPNLFATSIKGMIFFF